uniref:Uncharacterized protein n=1 Tax=Cacopsylla melanoneura TaxID=428564 RepID=A0A8D8Q4Y7_9HEMI
MASYGMVYLLRSYPHYTLALVSFCIPPHLPVHLDCISFSLLFYPHQVPCNISCYICQSCLLILHKVHPGYYIVSSHRFPLHYHMVLDISYYLVSSVLVVVTSHHSPHILHPTVIHDICLISNFFLFCYVLLHPDVFFSSLHFVFLFFGIFPYHPSSCLCSMERLLSFLFLSSLRLLIWKYYFLLLYSWFCYLSPSLVVQVRSLARVKGRGKTWSRVRVSFFYLFCCHNIFFLYYIVVHSYHHLHHSLHHHSMSDRSLPTPMLFLSLYLDVYCVLFLFFCPGLCPRLSTCFSLVCLSSPSLLHYQGRTHHP